MTFKPNMAFLKTMCIFAHCLLKTYQLVQKNEKVMGMITIVCQIKVPEKFKLTFKPNMAFLKSKCYFRTLLAQDLSTCVKKDEKVMG